MNTSDKLVALAKAEELRGLMEDGIIKLDTAIAQGEFEYEQMRKAMDDKRAATNELWRKREAQQRLVRAVSEDMRDLRRPREGYPQMSDEEYEGRMDAIIQSLRYATEDTEKQSAWAE